MVTKRIEVRRASSRLAVPFVAILGPGLLVMLADTDAGSLITAAQSGTRFGYEMILPQLLLIPVLYVVQEMTARLGIVTRKGHGALIREHFGQGWALLSGMTLFLSAVGALLTEFAGVAGVSDMFGIPRVLAVSIAALFLIAAGVSGSYNRAERIGIFLGLAELFFLPLLVLSHPHFHAIMTQVTQIPAHNSSYMMLLAANVGAVIMPWMIFYQQGAVIDKGLDFRDIKAERRDTAIGAVLTQLIMVATVATFAATAFHVLPGKLDTIAGMASALQLLMNKTIAKVLLAMAVLGAALVAALVASIAGAWGISEVLGWKHSLNERPCRNNAKFYATYLLAHILGAVLVIVHVNLVGLVLDVMVMNALLLPIVLGFLIALEARALPRELRMHGFHRWAATSLSLVVIVFGLYMLPGTLLHL